MVTLHTRRVNLTEMSRSYSTVIIRVAFIFREYDLKRVISSLVSTKTGEKRH